MFHHALKTIQRSTSVKTMLANESNAARFRSTASLFSTLHKLIQRFPYDLMQKSAYAKTDDVSAKRFVPLAGCRR